MSGLRLCVRDVYAYSFAFVGFGRFYVCTYACVHACMYIHTPYLHTYMVSCLQERAHS